MFAWRNDLIDPGKICQFHRTFKTVGARRGLSKTCLTTDLNVIEILWNAISSGKHKVRTERGRADFVASVIIATNVTELLIGFHSIKSFVAHCVPIAGQERHDAV